MRKAELETAARLNNHFSTSIYVKRSQENDVMRKLHDMEMALSKMGIHFSVGPSRNQGIKNFLACVLTLTIDRDITSRGAGRRPMETGLSLSDIEALVSQGKSPQEIAASIGMSRATYYRHLSKARMLLESGEDAANIDF